ncbi:hypothetical protein AB0A63_13885 [Lentzea sp. NPDC042327]|uniref:hypothetical protein n=1 Tax=Lentzea sp. NPDC042327 TaxID=3154801 RepID=UPI003409D3DF
MSNVRNNFHRDLNITSAQIGHAAARATADPATGVRSEALHIQAAEPRHHRTHAAGRVTNTWTGDVPAGEVLIQAGGRTVFPAAHIEPEPCAICGQDLSPEDTFCDWCHERRTTNAD